MAELKDRYAAALFELSLESGMLEEHAKQAAIVRDALENERLQSFMQHPHIPDAAKRELLQSLFKDGVSDDLMGLLFLAISKSREAMIVPALTAYIDMKNRHTGKMVASVVSASQLSERQLSKLHAVLSEKTNKQVELLPRVDASLLGGFYIHLNGYLIDRTVRTQLSNMKESLKRGGANE
ncbi:MAG: ATP synthase F1 subunit delta [Christensenellales bacterium]|jgi:F-type H+-transporting ATPase subunit delta